LNDFKALGLSHGVLTALESMGFEQPTPIQEQTIPILLADQSDFIGLAQTGTGKTAAFGLPLMELLEFDDRNTQALILAPTRELAQQIASQLDSFSQNLGKLKTVCVYGGASISTQISQLKRGAQIIVATPGRLIDLAERKAVHLDQLRYLILDEADEMLNMGFKEALDQILSFTPEDKLTWLFSATMPAEIRRIVKSYMHDPKEVKVNVAQRVNENIDHQFVITKASEKPAVLKRFLDFDMDLYGVIFCRTKRDTQSLAEILVEAGYPAEPLHGDLSQAQRDAVMKRFRSGMLRVLVATDVAARGIDVNNLTHVIHYALPNDAEYYTHRSGRTARAGRTGISLSLITKADRRKISYLESKLGITFNKAHIPNMEEISANRIARWAESLASFEADFKLPKEAINQAYAHLADFSREELIEKLVGRELSHLKDEPVKIENQDFDESSDRGSRSRRDGDENMVRFFIGVGLMDQFNKGKLLRLICDHSKLTSKDIGRISLQRMHSYFDVEADSVAKADAIKSLELDGRNVRVNRDDDNKARVGGKSGGGGKKKRKDNFRSSPRSGKGKKKRY
tara:strand:+ start:147 stop:1856 length:1710 start_codon:yes stop_codon:yes gene_type:complete